SRATTRAPVCSTSTASTWPAFKQRLCRAAITAICARVTGARADSCARLRRLFDVFAADVLVRPVFAFERPILFVVAQVTLGIDGIDDGLRQKPLIERFDFELERALLAEHGFDATKPSAAQEARQTFVEADERVFGERELLRAHLLAELGRPRVELS